MSIFLRSIAALAATVLFSYFMTSLRINGLITTSVSIPASALLGIIAGVMAIIPKRSNGGTTTKC